MSTSSDPRVRELNRLKLAMATFALQLDTFEVRAYGVMLSIGRPSEDGPGHGRRKEDEIGSQ
jgi:nitroreductase